MNLPLSARLRACCRFIRPTDTVVDIGCDHGYLGIYLLKNGLARRVIASDIRQMPLQSARRNAERFGLGEEISFYLSDGAAAIPRDFDVLVCAGMGADTIISVLKAAPWLCRGDYRLILQCQSKRPRLRRYLSESGWYIKDETVLRDGRFLYTVIHAVYRPESAGLTDGGCYLSPALLRCGAPELNEFCTRTLSHLQRAVRAQGDTPDAQMRRALAELSDLPIFTSEGETP